MTPTLDAITEATAVLSATIRKRCDYCQRRPWYRLCALCGKYVCRQCYSRPEHAQDDMNARKEMPS